MTGKKYNKRICLGEGASFSDAFFLARNAGTSFTVTQVDACRYCSFLHSRAAGISEVGTEENASLSCQVFDSSPPEKIPALSYDQLRAEPGGKPDRKIREKFFDRYWKKKSRYIEYVLRSARMANLPGNSFDYAVYCTSFGRWRTDG